MKKENKIMYVGLIIQLLSIVYMLVCMCVNHTVSGFVTITMFLGLLITLISSFVIRKENTGVKEKNNAIIFFTFLLILIMLVITFITV